MKAIIILLILLSSSCAYDPWEGYFSPAEEDASRRSRIKCKIPLVGTSVDTQTEAKRKCYSKHRNNILVKAGLREANPKSGYGDFKMGYYFLTRDEINKIKLACWEVQGDTESAKCIRKEVKKIPRKVEWKSER